MAATLKLLGFLAPAVAGAPDADQEAALALAASYRPWCLPEVKQDEAQVWYAAWLLYGRQQQTATVQAIGVVPAGIASEKEGDLARSYTHDGGGNGSIADPMGFRARYEQLAALCGFGAIVAAKVSHGCRCQDR
ncbi:DUF4054 domain-containing protein [Cupriavidus sp. D384]|uniref:DUF4054 domain-containing protein n=1 Tax=Cupriavidus sp. D384 TaxID=1538095 RepID=UPI0008375E84|nr:DUF4054 domain-containing protein [Cupriavidus sp. D384]